MELMHCAWHSSLEQPPAMIKRYRKAAMKPRDAHNGASSPLSYIAAVAGEIIGRIFNPRISGRLSYSICYL